MFVLLISEVVGDQVTDIANNHLNTTKATLHSLLSQQPFSHVPLPTQCIHTYIRTTHLRNDFLANMPRVTACNVSAAAVCFVSLPVEFMAAIPPRESRP